MSWGANALGMAAMLLALGGCSSQPNPESATSAGDDDAITIASFDFPESELLAEIYAGALEAEDYDVERAGPVGPRELIQPALAGELIEFVPEYAGSALSFLSLGAQRPEPRPDATHEGLRLLLDGTDVVALAPSPAESVNVFVVTRDTADLYGLTNISDLSGVADTLTLGGPPECPSRPFCLGGLERVYGLTFESFLALDTGGPLTAQALDHGHVDVALLFSTDPRLDDEDLVVLNDDRHLQPAESVTPLVRAEVVERWGSEFEATVDAVSQRLTTDGLRSLNRRLANGESVRDVAQDWLADEGLA
jgi:osmoprotectant transport system substrate-binding protein